MNIVSQKYSKVSIVDSELGKANIDSKGAPISGVRMDESAAYARIPRLLQKFINNNDSSAWTRIIEKIDYIYSNLDYAMEGLDRETDFSKKVKSQIKSGKKFLFKPNLVSPLVIDQATHGEGWVLPSVPNGL